LVFAGTSSGRSIKFPIVSLLYFFALHPFSWQHLAVDFIDLAPRDVLNCALYKFMIGAVGMENLFRLTLIAVGIVNAFPLVGAIVPDVLSSLYGIPVNDPNLLVLLRHRAVLFGLLGGLMIIAAFDSSLYNIATLGGLISMLAYVFIVWQTGDYNSNIRQVMIVDIVASVVLLVAYLLYRRSTF
jgi:hypothetical protein